MSAEHYLIARHPESFEQVSPRSLPRAIVRSKPHESNPCLTNGGQFHPCQAFLCRAVSFWLSLDEERCDNQNDGQPNLNIEHRPETIVNIVERLVYCAFRIFQRSHVHVIIPKHNQQQMRKSPI